MERTHLIFVGYYWKIAVRSIMPLLLGSVALWLFATSAHAAVVTIGAIITDSNATAYGQLRGTVCAASGGCDQRRAHPFSTGTQLPCR